MLKKIIIPIFIIILSSSAIHSINQTLSELTSALNHLQNVASKLSISSSKRTLPTKEFYQKLYTAILAALNHNYTELDAYGSNQSAETARQAILIANQMQSTLTNKRSGHLLAKDIQFIVQIYDRIKLKYKTEDPIIITALSSGSAFHEEILLRLLYHSRYRSIKFYAIDPSKETATALQKFKEDHELNNFEIKPPFPDAKNYVEQIINGTNEHPNVCLTVGPIMLSITLEGPKGANICKKDNSLLITPNYVHELSAITNDEDFIKRINASLAAKVDLPDISISFTQFKEWLIESLDTREQIIKRLLPHDTGYICSKSIPIDFLEIIKLASSINNDCIAYLYTADFIQTFHNIASKSVAQLYLEILDGVKVGIADVIIPRNQRRLWIYNSRTNQFERM